MNSASARKIADSSVEILWFVARGEILKGPFSTEQLEERIRRHEITFLDFCWRQGFREWRPIASVDDFERRRTLKRVPSYPVVAVPCSLDTPSVPAEAAAREKMGKRIEVNFAKSRRQNITVYEWGVAVIFCVILAYIATSFALREVETAVSKRIQYHELGMPQAYGSATGGSTPQMWSSLYSAPGFTEFPFEALENQGTTPTAAMPVKIEGVIREDAKGNQTLIPFSSNHGAFAIRSMVRLPSWQVTGSDLDPVYVRSAILSGNLSPRGDHTLLVPQTGDPLRVE